MAGVRFSGRMSAARKGHGRRGMRELPKKPHVEAVRSDINVTPLVDVCLVLLIIFMVITPLMARGKEVPLPTTTYHSAEKDRLQPVISIDKNETVWLSGRDHKGKTEQSEAGKIGDPKLIETLSKEIKRFWELAKTDEAKGRIFLKVDNSLKYGRVYPLLIELNDAIEPEIDIGTGGCKPVDPKCREELTEGAN